jgi:hypothetical protein
MDDKKFYGTRFDFYRGYYQTTDGIGHHPVDTNYWRKTTASFVMYYMRICRVPLSIDLLVLLVLRIRVPMTKQQSNLLAA